MSKIEAGRVELMEERFDLKETIYGVMRMMASRAFSGGLRLEQDVREDLPIVYADPRLMKQVLINLVGNAVKYTASGGTVLVRAYTDSDGDVVIEVKDTGVGIPKDKIGVAMEPFGQVGQHANEGRYQGTGLGLPLAKTMMELHGGKLVLTSEEGQGTMVTITLPHARTDPSAGSKDASPLARYKKQGKPSDSPAVGIAAAGGGTENDASVELARGAE